MDDHAHGDGVKAQTSSLSHGACANDVRQHYADRQDEMRAHVQWKWSVVYVRIVQCHAIIDVVIDVRIMECHASMDVVIGVRVVLCHQVIDFPLF